jgi:hypothetical protein
VVEGQKNKYLVVFDYGMGSIWAYMYARSEREVTDRYPLLRVVKEPPGWVQEEPYQEQMEKNTFDVDDPPSDWLRGCTKRKTELTPEEVRAIFRPSVWAVRRPGIKNPLM